MLVLSFREWSSKLGRFPLHFDRFVEVVAPKSGGEFLRMTAAAIAEKRLRFVVANSLAVATSSVGVLGDLMAERVLEFRLDQRMD